MNIGVYKITSPSGRVYVGQSVELNKRKSFYKSVACKSQVKLYRSLKKYGFENHSFEVICECEMGDLNKMERHYQELYNTITDGLNCMYVATDVLKAERSIETKLKIGAFNKGRKRPASECEKISIGRKGIKFTDLHCENIRISKTGDKNKRSRPVINLETGIFYDSVIEASKSIYGLTDKTLSRYLLGTRKNKTSLKFA